MQIPLTEQLSDQYASDPYGQILRNVVVTDRGVRLRPGAKDYLDTGESAAINGVFDWYNQSQVLVVVNGKIYSLADSILDTGASSLLLETGDKLLLEDGSGSLLLDTVAASTDVTGDAIGTSQPISFANWGNIVFFADGGYVHELHASQSLVSYDDGGGSRNYSAKINHTATASTNEPATGGNTWWTDEGTGNDYDAWTAGDRYGSGTNEENTDFPNNVSFVGIAKGHLILQVDDSENIHYSVINKPWEYDTDFVTANQIPDDNVSMQVYSNNIWVAGNRSIQSFVYDGSTPWRESTYGAIDVGCAARFSFREIDSNWIFLDNSRRLVALPLGGREARVLSESLNTYLKTIPIVTDMESDEVTVDGITYYVGRFPSSSESFMVNINNGTWTEVDYNNNGTYLPLDVVQAEYVPRWDLVIAGTRDGRIVSIDSNHSDDSGTAITGYIRSPRIQTADRVRVSKLIVALTKTATVSSSSTSSFSIRWRDDGEEDWSTARTVTIADNNVTDHVIELYRLGSYRHNRQYELSVDNLWPYSIQRVEQI